MRISPRKFVNAMNKGWETARYLKGDYQEKRKGHMYACAYGAAGLALRQNPAFIDVYDGDRLITGIVKVSDGAESKRKARKAVAEFLLGKKSI